MARKKMKNIDNKLTNVGARSAVAGFVACLGLLNSVNSAYDFASNDWPLGLVELAAAILLFGYAGKNLRQVSKNSEAIANQFNSLKSENAKLKARLSQNSK